ncbi:hypothetical protein [Cupriavidus metallidurans]|uniref:hypothetical protein n=1 Tax=Cupriavidus metallidurans TaxID=119219 RepID=UPI001CC8FA34|nr:hypothetical protein [Cupriavidus metallidurans]UBM12692.1 hypothetical protein LAI70_28170 [Cupriavidus metallidurans]
MSDIKITVAGHVASGKSAVAHVVAQALQIAGLNVELVDENGCGVVDEVPGVIESTLGSRVTSLAKRGTLVKVQTVQVNRTGVL